MRLFRIPSCTIASNFSAITDTNGYASRSGAGRSSSRVRHGHPLWCNRVAEREVHQDRGACSIQKCAQPDTPAFVQLPLPDRGDAHRIDVECQAILETLDSANGLHHSSNRTLVAVSERKQVKVPGGPVWFFHPYCKEACALQYESVSQVGLTQAVEKTFTGIAIQQELKIRILAPGPVQKARPDGSGDVGSHSTPVSSIMLSLREGRTLRVRASASVVTFLSPSASFRASSAASYPMRRWKRKQSTMVRAGSVMRAGTPSKAASSIPWVHAAPLNLTRRTPSSESAGRFALCWMPIQTCRGNWLPILHGASGGDAVKSPPTAQ